MIVAAVVVVEHPVGAEASVEVVVVDEAHPEDAEDRPVAADEVRTSILII